MVPLGSKGIRKKGSEKVDKGPQRLKRVKINVSNQQWGIFRCISIGQIIFLLDENLRGFHIKMNKFVDL